MAEPSEDSEQAYLNGRRAAWLSMLLTCLEELGYSDVESQKVAWITEREETIAVLRIACEEFGDNDWEEDLHLSDIIDKHLVAYIEEEQ